MSWLNFKLVAYTCLSLKWLKLIDVGTVYQMKYCGDVIVSVAGSCVRQIPYTNRLVPAESVLLCMMCPLQGATFTISFRLSNI